MPSKWGSGMDLYLFSLGVKLTFIPKAMLSCKLMGDMHVAYVVFFCFEVP